MILAIETATPVCSVAFEAADGRLHHKWGAKQGKHSEWLFMYIQELLNGQNVGVADLEAVLVSSGPGSYTGLRIAASAVKGLLFQSRVPLYKVNTLASYALNAFLDHAPEPGATIHCVIDARRRHLYYQRFRAGTDRVVPENEVSILELEHFPELVGHKDLLVGTGTERLPEEVLDKVTALPEQTIHAGGLAGWYHIMKDKEALDRLDKIIEPVDVALFEPDYHTEHQTVKNRK